MSDSRTAKATATRMRRRNLMRDRLFDAVAQTPAPYTDWRYAFDLDMPLPAVRLAFLEDPRFPSLMRAGKIAVPARTLKYPRWATFHLNDEERSKLPTISNESKLPDNLLPTVHTGDKSLDADIDYLQDDHLEFARRLSPRKARARLAEAAIVYGRVIDHNARSVSDSAKLRQDDHIHRQHIARLEREKQQIANRLATAEATIARLNDENPMPPPPGGDEARAH